MLRRAPSAQEVLWAALSCLRQTAVYSVSPLSEGAGNPVLGLHSDRPTADLHHLGMLLTPPAAWRTQSINTWEGGREEEGKKEGRKENRDKCN